MSIAQIISDILSIITIGLCFILKIPQIVNIYKAKSAIGINIYGLLLELTSYSVMTCYNYCNGYSLLSYMEYPIILVQEVILIYLVLKFKSMLNSNSFILFGVYLGVVASFCLGLIPKSILSILAPLCTPVSASSKIVQLMEILKTKNASSVSILTWFLSAFTNLTRVYTIYMDSADVTLLANFCISVFLSSSIMIAAIVYRHPKQE